MSWSPWLPLTVVLGVLAGPVPEVRGGDKPTAPQGVLVDNEKHFSVQMPSGFAPAKAPPGSQARYYFAGPGGAIASVSYFESANRAAYQKRKSAEFLDALERGLAASTHGYRLRRRKFHRVERTPTLDLEWDRIAPTGEAQRVYTRFLFRYRNTTVATITFPQKAHRSRQRQGRLWIESLRPLQAP